MKIGSNLYVNSFMSAIFVKEVAINIIIGKIKRHIYFLLNFINILSNTIVPKK